MPKLNRRIATSNNIHSSIKGPDSNKKNILNKMTKPIPQIAVATAMAMKFFIVSFILYRYIRICRK